MSESFAPLVTPALPVEEPAFAPFALKLLKGPSTTTPVDAAPQPPGPAAAPPCAPLVTLQRSGEVVSAIRVQCSCGQVIELHCVYDESKTS